MIRYSETKLIGITGILGNIFLLIIKLIVSLTSNSSAMIADTFNSAGDIFASIMTTVGNKIASVPKDDNHNFGHGKAEYIFSLLISISMILISTKLIYNSILSIINKDKIVFSYYLIIVCIITIIVKFGLYLYSKIVYKRNKNILIKSNMIDHRNDCMLSILTCISIILSKYNIYYIDGIVGIIISIWILYSGIKIFIESYNILMDISVDDNIKKRVLDILEEYDSVKKYDDMYYVPTGYKYVLVFTIFVDGDMKTIESHEIADNIENEIKKKIDKIHTVIIHVNPINKK